jgi:hypothetical protein
MIFRPNDQNNDREETAQMRNRSGTVLATLLFFVVLISATEVRGLENLNNVSLVIGPDPVMACVGEPIILQATATNESEEPVGFYMTGQNFFFDLTRDDGTKMPADLSYFPSGFEGAVPFRLDPGQEVSVSIAFPVLLRPFDGGDERFPTLGPGTYEVAWHCKSWIQDALPDIPFSMDHMRSWPYLEARGSFTLHVEEGNEGCRARAYARLRKRYLDFERHWSERHTDPVQGMELKALRYTLHALDDEAALPYLEQMKAVENNSMKEIVAVTMARIQFDVENYGHAPVTPGEKGRKMREKMEQRSPR